MNEILKFKQGRKVLSAKFGDNFKRVGTASNGLSGIYFNPDDNQLWKGGLTGYSRIGDTYSYYSGLGGGTIKASDYIEKPKTKVTTRTSSNPGEIVVNGKRYASKADWVKEQRAQREQPLKVVIIGKAGKRPTSKVTPRGLGYWDKQYQDFLGKMTDDQKAWLAQRGIDYSSAEKMQSYLANHDQNLGKWGADGKWAGASQAAWDNFVNTTMKNNPLQKPAPEPVVDSPDLSQPGTFNTDMTFNKDNIRANRGVNYSDVDQLWDYIGSHGESTEARLFNNVLGGLEGDAKKNAFMQMMDKYKVSGNLGRRDSGRLATMFNDLNLIGTKGTAARLSYVNSFNSSFNKAQQENADARMDAARQQYAAKMAQQYTELNPVQLTAPKKFTIGSGIGASTLGNAGAGSMTELNLDDMSPREKFAMGL